MLDSLGQHLLAISRAVPIPLMPAGLAGSLPDRRLAGAMATGCRRGPAPGRQWTFFAGQR